MILPSRGLIYIQIVESDSKTKSGLYVSNDEDSMSAKVLEIGGSKVLEDGVVSNPPEFILEDKDGNSKSLHYLKRGDIIFFKRHTAHELENYGEEEKTALIPFDSVLAIQLRR